MALPRKGDPRRPLHLAVRSTRMLAILFLLFGTFGMIPMFFQPMRGGGRYTFIAISVLMFYFGPGAAYLVLSIYLSQRRYWAIVASIVLASIQLLFTLIGAISLIGLVLPSGSTSFLYIPLGIIVFMILALAQLIYHLVLSFTSLKYAPVEQQRGFEPIKMAIPIDSPPPPADPNQPPPGE